MRPRAPTRAHPRKQSATQRAPAREPARVQPPRGIRYTRLDEIRPAESNPRKHDLPSIKASLRDFGFIEIPVEDLRSDRLVGGHGRMEALVEMRAEGAPVPEGIVLDNDGMWMVPVVVGWASGNDTEASAALIALNRLTENARWNDHGLAVLMEQVATTAPNLLDATGFDADHLDKLLAPLNIELLGPKDPALPERTRRPDALDESGTVTLDQYRAANPNDPDPDNITCPACNHRWPRRP